MPNLMLSNKMPNHPPAASLNGPTVSVGNPPHSDGKLATYVVRSPDGTRYRVTAPADATEQDVIAYVQRAAGSQTRDMTPEQVHEQARQALASHADPMLDPTGSFTENALDKMGGVFTGWGRGAQQLWGDITHKPTPEVDQAVRESARLDQPLNSTAGGKVGDFIAHAAPYFVAGPGIGAGVLAGMAEGASAPTMNAQERLANALVGGAIGGTGNAIGAGAKALLTRNVERTAERAAANAVRDSALSTGRKAGYTLPPSTSNPSPINRFLEGIAGKNKTAQEAAARNQGVTNRLIREQFGIPEDAPLSTEEFGAVRNAAGQAYEAARNLAPLKSDSTFANAVKDAIGPAVRLLKDPAYSNTPEAATARQLVKKFLPLLKSDSFGSSPTVDYVRFLRYSAKNANREKPAGLMAAQAEKGVADALERLLERNAEAQGKSGVVNALKTARTTIAQAHDVEKAFNPSTGNVRAQVLARALQNKKPLSGNLKLVGDTYNAATGGRQLATSPLAEVNASVPSTSPLDAGVAVVGALHGATPVSKAASLIAALTGRPALRRMILSAPYQRLMSTPSYSPATMLRLIRALTYRNPLIPAAGMSQIPYLPAAQQ